METKKSFNPQVIHETAAYLFWTLANKNGVLNTQSSVLESSGSCLFEDTQILSELKHIDFSQLDDQDRNIFANAIAEEALFYSRKELNMDGTIYAEDFTVGRSPDAKNVDVSLLDIKVAKIDISPNIEIVGRLCLRHPLPGVVFSKKEPKNSIIQIKNTSKALGFNYPLFLLLVGCTPIENGLFALSGIFQIPVPYEYYGNLWSKIIQNSTCFYKGATFVGESGETSIQVLWPNN